MPHASGTLELQGPICTKRTRVAVCLHLGQRETHEQQCVRSRVPLNATRLRHFRALSAQKHEVYLTWSGPSITVSV